MEHTTSLSHYETSPRRVRSSDDGKTRWFPVLAVAHGDVAGVRPTWGFWQMGKGGGATVSSWDEARGGEI